MKVKNKFLILSLLIGGTLIASNSSQVSGKVTYEGKAPRAKKLNMAADPICGKSHDGPVFNESFKINGEEQYLENVVVWINNPNHAATIPETAIELDQIGCRYIPHVTGIMKGQDLMMKKKIHFILNVMFIHG